MPVPATVKLNTGAEMPIIQLGTWKSSPGKVEKAVEHALKVGYKGVDTATAYRKSNLLLLSCMARG